MPSRAEDNNRRMTKLMRQKLAERVQRAIQLKTQELQIDSKLPKPMKFKDSIQIKWVSGKPIVGSVLPHADNIEFGRQAGKHVPIQPLVDWVIAKKGALPAKAVAEAHAVESKIYHEGIRGRHPVALALQDIEAGRF